MLRVFLYLSLVLFFSFQSGHSMNDEIVEKEITVKSSRLIHRRPSQSPDSIKEQQSNSSIIESYNFVKAQERVDLLLKELEMKPTYAAFKTEAVRKVFKEKMENLREINPYQAEQICKQLNSGLDSWICTFCFILTPEPYLLSLFKTK